LGRAFFLAGDVTEVGTEYPVTDLLAVGQLHVALLIDVFQAGMPGADHGVVAVETVLTTGEVEVITLDETKGSARVERHLFAAGIVALAVFPELAAVQGQAVDLV